MEFPLIVDRALKLGPPKYCIAFIDSEPSLPGDLPFVRCERATSSYNIHASQKLVKYLESHGIANQLYPGKVLEGPRLNVAFPPGEGEGGISQRGFLRIDDLTEMASSLGTGDGFDAKIRLDIEQVARINKYGDDSDYASIWIKPLPTSCTYIFPLDQKDSSYRSFDVEKYTGEGDTAQPCLGETPLMKYFYSWLPCQLNRSRGRNTSEERHWFEYRDRDWEITVSLTLLCSPIICLGPEIPYLLKSLGKIMLSEEMLALDSDLTIVTENGSEIKAHRFMLAAHSSVFRAMFQSGMLEAQTGILELEGISEESVRALRDLLYVWERTSAEKNPDICVDLLEAGHKYDIPPLEFWMKQILLSKPNEWYTPDAVLHLAAFTKNIQHEELQKLAIELLKAMQHEVETSPTFRKLCEENEKSEKEVFEYLTTI